MNYSPVNNELCSSFHKIGSEIDEIFSSLDIFSQSSESCLKGGSSVDFLGSKESDPKESYPNSVIKELEPELKMPEYCAFSNPSVYHPDLTHTEHYPSNPPTFRAHPITSDDIPAPEDVPKLPLGVLDETASLTTPMKHRVPDFSRYDNSSSTPINGERYSSPAKSPLNELPRFTALSPTKSDVAKFTSLTPSKSSVVDFNKYPSRSSTPIRVDRPQSINSNQSMNNAHQTHHTNLFPEKRMKINSSNHHEFDDEITPATVVNHGENYSSTPSMKRGMSPSFSTLPSKVVITNKNSGIGTAGYHSYHHVYPHSPPPVVAGESVSGERERWRKHQDDMLVCRNRIMDLAQRIHGTIEHRNMLLYKVEASVRLVTAQVRLNKDRL